MKRLNQSSNHTVLVIACGAISHELNYLKTINSWDHITIQCLNADLHNTPKKIPNKIKEKLDLVGGNFDQVFIAYADCGTGGLLDSMLNEYNIKRLPGAHCYEFFTGLKEFKSLMDNEIGTFYLTDFLVKHFNRLIIKGLGIDKHPQLKDEYFRNYKKLTYLAQSKSEKLANQAKYHADYLNLEFAMHYTGLDNLKKNTLEGIQ